MMGPIYNANSKPMFQKSGTVPDVSGAMQSYFQPMTFETIVKNVVNFQTVETPTPLNFFGVIQPFTDRQLLIKPEGERAWSWFWLHAEPTLVLEVDSVVIWEGVQTRVMSQKDYSLYGYVEYHLCQDWTGAGP